MLPASNDLWSEEGGSAALHGRVCGVCRLKMFPPQRYGCPGCGAFGDQLLPVRLAAIGRLHSFAVVNQHPTLETPYTVVEVELDAGPLVRALFDPAAIPVIDGRVAGRAAGPEGNRELMFTAAGEGRT